MSHYRQILINLSAEDAIPEEKLEELAKKVEDTVREYAEKEDELHEFNVRLN